MENYILYMLAALAVAIALIIITILRKIPQKGGEVPQREAVARAVPINRDDAPVRARRRGAQQRMAAAARRQQDSDEEEENEDIAAELGKYEGKIGAKKMRKLQEKAERKAQREAEFHEREERKEREAKLEAQRKRDEAKQAALEKAQEEEARLLKEEQERKEHEEYLLLKQAFTVDEEGIENTQDGEDDSKVVMLEDLAAHFQIKTQDAIDRINSLVDDGRLSGVMDDRGKFIFITQEEYEAVARFIKQRGRVSLTELAESSNRLINMNPEQTASRPEVVK